MPVYNHVGAVVGAVSISGPAFRFEPEEEPGLLDGLKEAGLKISTRLGYARH